MRTFSPDDIIFNVEARRIHPIQVEQTAQVAAVHLAFEAAVLAAQRKVEDSEDLVAKLELKIAGYRHRDERRQRWRLRRSWRAESPDKLEAQLDAARRAVEIARVQYTRLLSEFGPVRIDVGERVADAIGGLRPAESPTAAGPSGESPERSMTLVARMPEIELDPGAPLAPEGL